MSSSANIDPTIEPSIPSECPFCDERLADPDDVSDELDPHEPTVDENQVFRRHRRQHVWDDLEVPEPEDDPLLEEYYDAKYHTSSSSTSTDNEDEDDEDDEDDHLDEYTVEFSYTAKLRVTVDASSELEAEDRAKTKKREEDLCPEPTELVHTRVSNW